MNETRTEEIARLGKEVEILCNARRVLLSLPDSHSRFKLIEGLRTETVELEVKQYYAQPWTPCYRGSDEVD